MVLNLNACAPAYHRLRAIKRQIDGVLRKLSPLLDEVCEERRRPSIPRSHCSRPK